MKKNGEDSHVVGSETVALKNTKQSWIRAEDVEVLFGGYADEKDQE